MIKPTKGPSLLSNLSALQMNPNIIPSLIPLDDTVLFEPLNISVNKPFKDLLCNILNDLLNQY